MNNIVSDIVELGFSSDKVKVLSGMADPNSTMGVVRCHLSMPIPPSDATGGVAKTFDVQIPAKRRPYGVRFMYLNLNASAPAIYTAIRAGAAPKHLLSYGVDITWHPNLLTVNNLVYSVVFTGALSAATSGTLATAWPNSTDTYNIVFSDGSVRAATLTNASTAVTWTGAVTATATAKGYPKITVPAASLAENGQHIIPGVAITDFIPLQPVERTDTPGGKYLFRVRSRSAAETQYTYQVGSGYAPSWNGYVGSGGMQIGSYQTNTDFATNPPTDNVYTVIENGGFLQPVVALFAYEESGTQVWAFGDSLFQGGGSSIGATASNGVLGWPTLVELQQTYIDVLNMAVGGQKTSDSISVMKKMISASDDLPEYVAIKVYSPNDGTPTTTTANTVWGQILDACSWLRTKGITPLLFTSPPVNSWTAGQHAVNEAQNERARNLARSCPWVKLVDMWSVISDPSNQRQILPAYLYTTDGLGTHYLDAGHQAIANEVVRVLTNLV